MNTFAFLFKEGPDGGIGRRAGLKHQWGDPCRFDPGSGYIIKKPVNQLINRLFYFSDFTHQPANSSVNVVPWPC